MRRTAVSIRPSIRKSILPCGAALLASWAMAAPARAQTVDPPKPKANDEASKTKAPEEPTDVRVVGSRVSQTAGSVHVLGKKQLERFEYDDPQAVLQAAPGVYGRGEDGVGLRPNIGMRGVNPDRSKKVTLMEDGVLFAPAPYSAPAAYYFPLITRMTQVRVAKGVGAIVFGPQTIGGAIDFLTRPVPTNGATGGLDAGFGSYGYNKLHGYFGSGDAKLGFLVEGIHLGNTGFKELPSGGDTGFVRNEWMLKGHYVLDPDAAVKNEFRLKVSYSDEISNETYVGLSDADFRANSRQRYAASELDRMNWHRTSVALTHVVTPSRELSITTTAYRHDLSRTWRKVNGFRGASIFDVLRNPEDPRNAIYHSLLRGQGVSSSPGEMLLVGPNNREFVSQGIDTRIRWNGTTGAFAHRLEYGMRLHYDRIERRHSEDAFQLVNGALVPAGEATVVTAYNEAYTHALAMHLADAVTWKSLTVTPGVRVESMVATFEDKAARVDNSIATQVVLPGLGAYYGFTDAFGVLAGVHRGFSPPTPGLDGTVRPELSVNYEAGARFTKGRARAEVIGFYNDYSNLTDVCTLSSGCIEQNLDRQFDAGKAKIYGVEAYVEHDIRLGRALRLPLTGAYTLTRGEFSTSFRSEDPIFGNVRAGDEMPYLPRHQVNGSVGLEGSRAGGALSVTYVSPMRELAGSEPISRTLATDEQLVFDASASVRVYGPITLYANLRNVFDAQNIVSRRPYGARPNAPRWIQVGAKVAF
jgi:Fe(3+) dicitrate transport protein